MSRPQAIELVTMIGRLFGRPATAVEVGGKWTVETTNTNGTLVVFCDDGVGLFIDRPSYETLGRALAFVPIH